MSKSPAFQFYPSDFLTDENVVLMSLEEKGAYIVLICYCWREGSIPAEISKLSRLCGCSEADMERHWQGIKDCFIPHPSDTGRLSHPRLEAEKRKQVAYATKQQAKAKTRWDKNKKSDATALPDLCHGIATALPKDGERHTSGNALQSSSSFSSSVNTSPNGDGQSPAHPIWGDALQMLVDQGEKESNARSFLGRAVKEYGEGAVNDAISACILDQPVNAKAFLMACLKSKPKKSAPKQQTGLTLGRPAIVPHTERKGGVLEI